MDFSTRIINRTTLLYSRGEVTPEEKKFIECLLDMVPTTIFRPHVSQKQPILVFTNDSGLVEAGLTQVIQAEHSNVTVVPDSIRLCPQVTAEQAYVGMCNAIHSLFVRVVLPIVHYIPSIACVWFTMSVKFGENEDKQALLSLPKTGIIFKPGHFTLHVETAKSSSNNSHTPGLTVNSVKLAGKRFSRSFTPVNIERFKKRKMRCERVGLKIKKAMIPLI